MLRDEAKGAFISEQAGYFCKAQNNKAEYLDRQAFEQLQVNNKNLAKAAISSINGIFAGDEYTQAQSQIDLACSRANMASLIY